MFNKDQLMEIKELMNLLGYSDERSIIKWCKKRVIPIIKAGLKKFILLRYLTQYIDNQIFTFEKENNIVTLQSDDPEKSKTNHEAENASITKYLPENDVVSQYLKKYESNEKSKAA